MFSTRKALDCRRAAYRLPGEAAAAAGAVAAAEAAEDADEDASAAEAVVAGVAAEDAVARAACRGAPAGGARLKHLSVVRTDVVRDQRIDRFELVIYLLFA